MIARTAHARGFSRLAVYLESDKADPELSRAAWWAPRNLPSSSIASAARWMERTAERNRRVQLPAYHLFVSVSPQDDASHPRMRAVADGLLRRLGLHEHQAVAVGHEDRAHPHLHIAVNRVHPVSLRAWDTTRDWPRIERALREIERDMGFRATPGRLAPTPDGRWCDNARAMPVGARRFELREIEKAERARAGGLAYAPRPSFLRHVRERFGPDVAAARSWADLESAAARHGLALVQTPRGLAVTDGSHGAAISHVAGGASLPRLTRDFGEDYVGYAARTQGPGRDTPAAGRGSERGPGTAPGGTVGAGATPAATPERETDAAAERPAAPAEPGVVRGRGAPAPAAGPGGGHGDAGGERRPGLPAAAGRRDPPVGGELPGEHGDEGRGAGDREQRHGAGRDDQEGARRAAGDLEGADGVAGGEHAGGGEQHRGGAARAGALGEGAEAPDRALRGGGRGDDVGGRPAGGPAPVPVLGDETLRRGGVEPRDGAHADLAGSVARREAGDPARARVGADAGDGRAPGAAFRVERVPGGWAVVDAPGDRRWTLAREADAMRLAHAASAAPPARLERAIHRLDRAAARPSQREQVARAAADELLDQAAAHCFADPVAASDVVRWNQLRRRGQEVRASLAAAPATFGELHLQAEEPETWARLPEPRHEHVPAWTRFRDAAETWLDVQEGAAWTPPAEFPPRPPTPALPTRLGGPSAAPRLPPAYGPPPPSPYDDPYPLGRERGRGLSL